MACSGCAPHIWGPGVWSLLAECAQCAEEGTLAHRETDPRLCKHFETMYVSLLDVLTMLLPCEPCRRFYASAWSVNEFYSDRSGRDPTRWVHALHTCVAYKIAGADMAPLPQADGTPSYHEWMRRLRVRRGTSMSMCSLADAFVFMCFQLECETEPARAAARASAFLCAFTCCAALLRHARHSPQCARFGEDMCQVMRAASAARHNLPGGDRVRSAVCMCKAVALTLCAVVQGLRAPSLQELHRHYEDTKGRVRQSRGPLPQWMLDEWYTHDAQI